MAIDFTIKEGDRLPVIAATLKGADGVAVNLGGATVKFIMVRQGATTPKVDAAAEVVDAGAGTVQYAWDADDTDTAGDYYAEWEVTFASTKKETFPNATHLTVRVFSDLG